MPSPAGKRRRGKPIRKTGPACLAGLAGSPHGRFCHASRTPGSRLLEAGRLRFATSPPNMFGGLRKTWHCGWPMTEEFYEE